MRGPGSGYELLLPAEEVREGRQAVEESEEPMPLVAPESECEGGRPSVPRISGRLLRRPDHPPPASALVTRL